MALSRRNFLVTGSLAAGALATVKPFLAKPAPPADLRNWRVIREMFNLDPNYVHLGLFFLASHPQPVRHAIESYRQKLDANPFLTVDKGMFENPHNTIPDHVASEIGKFIGANAQDIALTHNTTTGLSLIYHGLHLKTGDEILTTNNDHYVHHEAIRLATERNGASWRKIPTWESWDRVSARGIVDHIQREIRPNTRVIGVTWVHSQSGIRLPIRRIADMITDVNRDREQRILLVVDGVHGIGVEDPAIVNLGADAFAAGLHKWIFAPRGTGFVWARPDVWASMRPLIPSFTSFELFQAWGEGQPPTTRPKANWFTPGGFQAFEHWWAVPAALDFHNAIGSDRITQRIHALNQHMNVELRKLPNVKIVYTPVDPELNAGMVCFDMKNFDAQKTVTRLLEKKIIASTTPYAVPFARVAFGIMNTSEEVERTVRAVRSLV
ncbi:MAG TPA: aminotransferase class V-fold PLP-dependent enzyme [Thermoanaerobaculia bacterium]|nr:aminotransferase class V-fold PLP-dependent enzyme [Thermoanaerobaculia bacterium]